MSKPEEVALAIERKYGDGNWSFELREAICEAVLAAKAEECEACALAAIEETKAPAQRNTKDQWVEQIGQHVAAAIRKRGAAK